ncbi:TPA: bifunctional phosphoribosylaminoimidazolecarboxamide formyltransferase/IMP cyclohydrolase, partial [Escherichia coli]|nr:bifunctional phosphoribosylaminoimidazolecarboxamide formyltransferase/IMP cyclohydrolase [Escherichia coli]
MAVTAKSIPAPNLHPVKRALISVSDKAGLTALAHALHRHGIEILSTGGTSKTIAAEGIPVIDVSEITNFPEIMDGRVKTLHPKVHGGLLAVRDDPEHADAMQAHGIGAIDLAVINLYPFEEVRHSGADYANIVENIDIGGPAMIRAAAKNHAYVGVVTDTGDYEMVIAMLDKHEGSLPYSFRQSLAAKAYARTATYDAAISGWFAEAL